MLVKPPMRHARRTVSLLSAAFLYGCADPSGPVAPPMPATPNALLAAVGTVTNTDDAGPGSLRQAILDAPDGAIIQFDPTIAGQTIVLSTGELAIDKVLTIEGPVPGGMTISGGSTSRVFHVTATGMGVFRNLSIVNGRDNSGAGIMVVNKATLDHVLVANNEATAAGGGILAADQFAEVTLLNSTVSGNTALNGGGIITRGVVTIRNSTIAQNTAVDLGGGIFGVEGPVFLRNSIIASNVGGATAGTSDNCSLKSEATLVFSGTNLSNDESCGTGAGMVVTGNPLLGPLANNGGPTSTHALLFGSPAIDIGTVCTESTDQRYVARNQGASCDAGAFEFDTFRAITLTIDPNVAVDPKTGQATVSGTLSCIGPAPSPLAVSLAQTQKTTGKFTTVVQAALNIPATCTSIPSSWRTPLTPATGKFQNGSATASASVLHALSGYLRPSVTAPVRLFQVK